MFEVDSNSTTYVPTPLVVERLAW